MEFGKKLQRLREKAGKSRYELSKLTALDQAFLGRLETGEKNPSRDTILKLGFALVHNNNTITLDDIDELLLAAEFAPLRKL